MKKIKKIILMLLLIIFVTSIIAVSIFMEINEKENSKIHRVSIINSIFNPNEIIINKGDTVIWINTDEETHTITPISNDNLENNIISGGRTFNHTFHTSGIYRYSDGDDDDDDKPMLGSIIVK